MTFCEFLNDAWKTTILPSTAREQLPNSLSEKTKKKLMRMKPSIAIMIIERAVEMVNKGSVNSLDHLINLEIDRWNE